MDSMATTEKLLQKSGNMHWSVWLPIPLMMLMIAGLWVADLHTAYDSPTLLLLLNLVFTWLASVCICVLTARAFLGSGQPNLLMFGCGSLLWGLTAVAATITIGANINPTITVHNLGVFGAALCHFGGMLWRERLPRPRLWLVWGYLAVILITVLLFWAAKAGWTPVFFVQGQGGTLIRQLVLLLTIILLAWVAWRILAMNRHKAVSFYHWYGLGLALLATGVTGVLLQSVVGSYLNWAGRIAQYLGGVYLFVGAIKTAREQGAWRISPTAVNGTPQNTWSMAGFDRQTAVKSVAVRYGTAVAAVAVAMVLRLMLETWAGTGLPTYITFYPAIMAVAVLAGFGPGVVATIVTGFAAEYWLLLPAGLFTIEKTIDRVGLVFFTAMGLGVSLLAELFRRQRHKAAAYDREMALRESQDILQRQVELIDPVRAEIIAREMLHVLRERNVGEKPKKSAGQVAKTSVVVIWGSRIAGWLAMFIGGFHLILWLGGFAPHWSMISGQTLMKTNMALGQLLAGISMLLLEPRSAGGAEAIAECKSAGNQKQSSRFRNLAGGVGALIVLAIGLLTLSEHIFHFDLGIDQLLAREVPGVTGKPNRICFSGSLNLTFLGAGLLALALRRRNLVPYLGLVVCLLNLLPVVGFLYGIGQFYSLSIDRIAWPVVLGMFSLGFGLFLIPQENQSIIDLLLSNDLGGKLLQRLLPAALLVPLLLGFLHTQGERLALINPATSTGALMIVAALLLSMLAVWLARYISRIDIKRREIDTHLRNQAEVINQAHESLIIREPSGAIRFWNRGAEALYGWTAAEAVGRNHHLLLHAEGHSGEKIDRQLESMGCWEGELMHTTRNGRVVIVESRQNTSHIGDGRFFILEANRDITERKRIEEEREATIEFLRFSNDNQSIEELIHQASSYFQKHSGCDAVGIRLQQGEDYPYCETRGFPADIVLTENLVCTGDKAGFPIRDNVGGAVFECICSSVIRGRFDPSKPFFTANGSFWSNGITDQLFVAADAERQTCALSRCNGEGYESVALIPLVVGAERLGLIQLNDRRKGRFTLANITLWERLASYLGVTIAKLRAEDALKKSEERFRTLANAIPQLCWTANPEGWIFWYNRRWYEYTGKISEQMVGWGWQSVHDPEILPRVLERWRASIATGNQFEMTFPLRGSDGVFRPFLTRVIPLKDSAGNVLQWFGTSTDVSEQQRVEQALRASEALYRGIGESIDYGVWTCAADGRNTYASESFLKMVGITQEQCSAFGWGDALHPDDAEHTIAAWQDCVRTGGRWDKEHRFRATDGQWHHVLARGVPIRDEQGEVISWAGINLDIDRLKQAEEQVKSSLTEKEVMLREIHHRVKNNLQIISSLVSLQADNLVDERMREELKDVRDRVRSMALVHEKLYQTSNLAQLNFGDYAGSLLHSLWRSHGALADKARLHLAVAPVALPIEAAVPCGLLLNELAGNALKHAFPGNIAGEVTVTLEHDAATGIVSLQVRDNGVGLPAGMDWRQSKSLGLRLVQILTNQLRGTLQTGSGPGTTFQVNFFLKEVQA